MTTLTLEKIEAEHRRLGDLIAAFKVQPTFPVTVSIPPMNEGEKFVGAIISADGKKRHALILLPGELESANWKDAMAWAKKIGGELPDRVESALLFAAMKDEFKPEWHWTREEHVSDPDFAWMQFFDYGSQNDYHKSYENRARAVRRFEIL